MYNKPDTINSLFYKHLERLANRASRCLHYIYIQSTHTHQYVEVQQSIYIILNINNRLLHAYILICIELSNGLTFTYHTHTPTYLHIWEVSKQCEIMCADLNLFLQNVIITTLT